MTEEYVMELTLPVELPGAAETDDELAAWPHIVPEDPSMMRSPLATDMPLPLIVIEKAVLINAVNAWCMFGPSTVRVPTRVSNTAP
jgi:hypothetical protein